MKDHLLDEFLPRGHILQRGELIGGAKSVIALDCLPRDGNIGVGVTDAILTLKQVKCDALNSCRHSEFQVDLCLQGQDDRVWFGLIDHCIDQPEVGFVHDKLCDSRNGNEEAAKTLIPVFRKEE